MLNIAQTCSNNWTKLGFTLAEVLITLSIIGIVAELTLPTLITSYKKQIYTTQLEKFYSEFQAGAKSYYASKDCLDLKCTGAFDGATTWCTPDVPNGMCPNLDDFVTKSFKLAENYRFNGTNQHQTYWLEDTLGMYQYYFTNGQYSFLTADNFLVGMTTYDTEGCSNLIDICAYIYVDVNGYNGPDILGRDTFQFYLRKDGTLIPDSGKQWQKEQAALWGGFGLSDADIESLTSSNYWRNNNGACGDPASKNFKPEDSIQGNGCSARIMENGWKMDY